MNKKKADATSVALQYRTKVGLAFSVFAAITACLCLSGCGGGSKSSGGGSVTTLNIPDPTRDTNISVPWAGGAALNVDFPANSLSQAAMAATTLIPASQLPVPITRAAKVRSFTPNAGNVYVTAFKLTLTPATITHFNVAVTISGNIAGSISVSTTLNLAFLQNEGQSSAAWQDVATYNTGANGSIIANPMTTAAPGILQPGMYVLYEPAPGSMQNSGAPPGTARIQSGPMNSVRGHLVNALAQSLTPQAVVLLETGGITETIPNVISPESLPANSDVILFRQGSQPIAATFTDSSKLFYSLPDGALLPIDSSGRTQTAYLESAADSFEFFTQSPLVVDGVTVSLVKFDVEHLGTDVGANPLAFPQSFYVDLPKAGEPMSSADAQLQYSSGLELHPFTVEAHLITGPDDVFTGTLRADGSTQFQFQFRPSGTNPNSTGTFDLLSFNVGS